VRGSLDGTAGHLDAPACDGQADEREEDRCQDRRLDRRRALVAGAAPLVPSYSHGLVTRSTVPWAVAWTPTMAQNPGTIDRQCPSTVAWTVRPSLVTVIATSDRLSPVEAMNADAGLVDHLQDRGPLAGVEGLRTRPAPLPGSEDRAAGVAVVRGPGPSHQAARRPHGRPGLGEGLKGLLDQRLDDGGVSVLSASDAKSSCAFP
jgi:hypothetical protein